MPASPISVELDQKALARFVKRSEKWAGRPLAARMGRATIEAARLLVGPIRSGIRDSSGPPAGTQATTRTRPGNLRRSVKAKSSRAKGHGQGSIASAWVGPTAPHRHFVIRSVRPHSLAPKRPGRSPYVVLGMDIVRLGSSVRHPGSKANPFVDEAAEKTSRQAYAHMVRVLRV